ncbi:hypothetical protein ACIPSA_41850 [Streptomyces sp. NPDC086549]|uniref:nSTAND1 domain-containing NTPase n=1 Tax=Streptomyces sp. NPDC086549 TaxID=3365752 RepID=UPI003817821F
MVALWRRVRPEQAEAVDAELAETRAQLLAARRAGEGVRGRAAAAAGPRAARHLVAVHGHTLTVDGYQASGGISHAVATTAERLYTSLTPAAQQSARTLFLRLVRIGDGVDDTRRRLPYPDLLDAGTDPSATAAVIDAYTRGRLLTRHQDTVEITHEALLHAGPSCGAGSTPTGPATSSTRTSKRPPPAGTGPTVTPAGSNAVTAWKPPAPGPTAPTRTSPAPPPPPSSPPAPGARPVPLGDAMPSLPSWPPSWPSPWPPPHWSTRNARTPSPPSNRPCPGNSPPNPTYSSTLTPTWLPCSRSKPAPALRCTGRRACGRGQRRG